LDWQIWREQRWILREQARHTKYPWRSPPSGRDCPGLGEEIGHTEAIKGLVAAGMGLGWISERAVARS
jgi:DNA-binding transcriptional LysR family regulator